MPNKFNKDAVIVAQNATIPAVQLTAATIAANPDHATTKESALDLYHYFHNAVFEHSMLLGGVEDIESFIDAEPARGGSAARPGGSRNNGGGAQDPGSVTFNVGKHKGKSIAEVYAEAPDYLTWAVEKMRNDFMVQRISAFLAQQS